VQDSDEEEDESQLESQTSDQDIRHHGRVERVQELPGRQPADEDAVTQERKDTGSDGPAVRGLSSAYGGTAWKAASPTGTSPTRPTPSPITPSTLRCIREGPSESPDPLQSTPTARHWAQGPTISSQLRRSPNYQRSSQEEIQLRAFALPSQILGEPIQPVCGASTGRLLNDIRASAILGEFGVAALSDNSQDETVPHQESDRESNLSDYPSDLSDSEPPSRPLYAEPHRRTAVQVVIPSSTALQYQLAAEEARQRNFRQRKPIQLHPYVLEGERYRREVQSRGLKPVPRERSPLRKQGQNNAESQEEEFNPFRVRSSSPPDPEIFVSTPVAEQAREDIQSVSSKRRSRLSPSRHKSPSDQLRLPKSVKRRRLEGTRTQRLATPARNSESSPLPLDIWSLPPDSPPFTSSPVINEHVASALLTRNEHSLPTPSDSSTLHDEPVRLPESDSDSIPRSVRRSGAELRRLARVVLSDAPSSSSGEASSESEREDTQLQQVSKKIKGVLPASWLRIDRQAQERRQTLARQRAQQNIQSPEPTELQRGIAQKIVRPHARVPGTIQPLPAADDAIVISDDSDQEPVPASHRHANDLRASADDASALAAIFDDRYAAHDDDLASMEHDRLLLPTLGGLGTKRKRQPKITDAFGNTKRTKPSTDGVRDGRVHKLAPGPSRRKKHVGSHRPRGTSPPALSVMDAELPPDAPQFLRLARRAARRDVNLARESPRRKQIRLHTEQDTRDATVTLHQWQQGLLRPKINPISSHSQTRRSPLVETTDNRQPPPKTTSLRKSSKSSNGADTGPLPMVPASRPRRPKEVAPALQVLQRSAPAPGKTARSKTVARAFSTTGKPVRHVPILPRAAQLEGNAKSVGRESRKTAFQRGLQYAAQQLESDPAFKQPNLNPQLARFLADDDAVLPPLPTAKDIGEVGDQDPKEVGSTRAIPAPKKRLKRKPQAQRLDIDIREYRQPSEPTFQPQSEPSTADPVPISIENAPLEQTEDMLVGLKPCGVRYPVTFDITPLKSDTYFHANTLVGSEDLHRALSIGKLGARELDEPAGYFTISHGSMAIRCGPWNDDIYSRLNELMANNVLPSGRQSGVESSQIPLANHPTALAEVLRKLITYISRHLSFTDPIDRQDFIMKMQQFLQNLFDRVNVVHTADCELEISPQQTSDTVRILSYLLVLGIQIFQVARHIGFFSLQKGKLLDVIKSIAQRLVKNVVGRTTDLYLFHERNRLHKERENGIQERDVLAECVVICMHTLDSLNEPLLGFWDLVSQELSLPSPAPNQTQVLENVWATVFSLLPFQEFDLSGIPDRHRLKAFSNDNWGCLNTVLKRILGLYDATCRQNGSSINDYVRVNLTRCYILINDWNWRRPDHILNTIFDFFGRRGLRPLHQETGSGSAEFLQRFTTAESLALSPNENSFHIALKCLATGLHGMSQIYPEKKIRSFVFRHIPNHGRTYPKDQSLAEEDLAALRSHHDLLATLYCAAPPSCRPKLDHIRSLVSHESSHREACRVSVRAWANLATFQVSTDETYASARPLALWYKDTLHQTLMQYRLAKTEAEDFLKPGNLHEPNEMVAAMVKQTMARNQSQVIATVREIISGMKHAVQCAKDHTRLASFLVDSNVTSLLELPHLDDRRLLCVIRDTLSVVRQYVSIHTVQTQQQISQPRSEESQDYGDFPDLDDLGDLDDVNAGGAVQTATVPQSPCLNHMQKSLWHLMSNAFGADHLSDDNLLMDCIDTWVLIAHDQISNGDKQWSHYLDSFSSVSWQQLRHTDQKMKFRPYFMAVVISRDRTAYKEHQFEFLTTLLLCLADRESMLRFQHRLLDAIVRADVDHPLLRNLPFFRSTHGGELDITAETVRSRRLTLISSLLSNMRDDVYATTIQEPGRVLEVKRTYAAMLNDFMSILKSNYQQLRQGDTVTGTYVEFVQKIVQFLKQYTDDICPVLPFFTDSVAFPLPSMDPTYVVGRLCGYAPKSKHMGTAKQLSFFIQTVAQQAAADNQQAYLVNQLRTVLCTGEALVDDRVALRTVLLQGIFPAYIEGAFASRVGHLIAGPILKCLPAVIDEMIYDLRVNQVESLSTAVENIVSIAHAFIRGTEHLKGDVMLLSQPSILNGLTHMFEISTSILKILDYIVGRTMPTGRPPLVTYLEEFNTYITQMLSAEIPQEIPSYRGDAHAALPNAQAADLLTFCTNALRSSLDTNWSTDQDGAVFFGRGQAKKEVLCAIRSAEGEKKGLLGALGRFRYIADEMAGDGHGYRGLGEVVQRTVYGDDVVV
jgi:hypothetical protein